MNPDPLEVWNEAWTMWENDDSSTDLAADQAAAAIIAQHYEPLVAEVERLRSENAQLRASCPYGRNQLTGEKS